MPTTKAARAFLVLKARAGFYDRRFFDYYDVDDSVNDACKRAATRAYAALLVPTSTTGGQHAVGSYHPLHQAVDFGNVVGYRPGEKNWIKGRRRLVKFQEYEHKRYHAGHMPMLIELLGPDNQLAVLRDAETDLAEGSALETQHDNHDHEAYRNGGRAPRRKPGWHPKVRPVKPVQARGVDVSSHQGRVDFRKLKAAGYAFVYVKSSEGEDWTDPTFVDNVRRAKAAGLKVGAYHFLRPRGDRPAEREVAHFHQLLKSAGLGRGDLRPVLDIEVTALDDVRTRSYSLNATRDLQRRTGIRPLLYTFPSFVSGKWNRDIANSADLWIAHYTTAGAPSVPAPWRSWAVWQFTSNGTVPGVAGRCDVNRTMDINKLVAR